MFTKNLKTSTLSIKTHKYNSNYVKVFLSFEKSA